MLSPEFPPLSPEFPLSPKLLQEHRQPAIAALGDMVHHAWEDNVGEPSHGGLVAQSRGCLIGILSLKLLSLKLRGRKMRARRAKRAVKLCGLGIVYLE